METLMPDRSTYRTYSDNRLIEEAKYDPNRELAIALGERLADALAEAETEIEELRERAADFKIDANRLDVELEVALDKIAELELMLSERERIIDEMQKGN
jgi:hypothetical protein